MRHASNSAHNFKWDWFARKIGKDFSKTLHLVQSLPPAIAPHKLHEWSKEPKHHVVEAPTQSQLQVVCCQYLPILINQSMVVSDKSVLILQMSQKS